MPYYDIFLFPEMDALMAIIKSFMKLIILALFFFFFLKDIIYIYIFHYLKVIRLFEGMSLCSVFHIQC